MHEFFHEFGHLSLRNTWLPQTKIERVIEELLVVRSHIDADGNRRLRSDAAHVVIMAVRLRSYDTYPAPAT